MYDYNRKLIEAARMLRNDATDPENHLWYDFLRKYRPKFQRQKTILNFIADFYCAKAKLVVELDGAHHYTDEGRDRDEERTAMIESLGIKVIRFTNSEIEKNFYGVCERIDATVRDRMKEDLT